MTLHRVEYKRRPYALYAFLWGLLLAAVIIAPIMIYDKGYFIYYGDFNVQEIPFYKLAHDSIRSGNLGWSHLTDLGANFIGSYTFYLLGSPFFWLTMALPSAWVAYAIGPLLALKLACASLTAYLYLRRYVKDSRYAVIGGLLYAFSGFSVYNIFFFHFHEAMIVFPLLLSALDEFHTTKRRGVVAAAVLLSALINYYFFVGQVIFSLIYYGIKLISRSYRFYIKEFLSLALECIIGLSGAAVLLLPSIAAIVDNYRVSSILSGWNALVYPSTQRYIQILVSFFFPGDIPARNNFTPSAGAKWSSVAAYLPLFSMTFVIAGLRERRRSFFSRMITVLFIMALVPLFNSLFQLLNSVYYARWFYMLTLMMTVLTVQGLEQMREIHFKKGFLPTLIVTLAVSLAIGLMPQTDTTDDGNEVLRIGVEQTPKIYWIFVAVAVSGLILTAFLYLVHRKRPRLFLRTTCILLSLFIVSYAELYLWVGKLTSDREDSFVIENALNYGEDVEINDLAEVRSDFYECMDNMGMFWQIPTINAFHSIVPASLMDFYNESGESRVVGSRPSTDFYGFRPLLSVKYLFADPDKDFTDHGRTRMPGYRYLKTANGCDIYENEYYIPMGFTYSRYITEEEYNDLSDEVKHLALLKAMVLTQDQMARYADVTGYTEGVYDALNAEHSDAKPQDRTHPRYETYNSIIADFRYTVEEYYNDVKALKKNVCSSFTYTNEGFEAEFENTGEDNLLFFSVPYDNGWSAYVNGEQADIEKVNIGFMAIRVKGHSTNRIVFRYRTPMLHEGMILSCVSLVGGAIYVIINRGFGTKRRLRKKYTVKQKHLL